MVACNCLSYHVGCLIPKPQVSLRGVFGGRCLLMGLDFENVKGVSRSASENTLEAVQDVKVRTSMVRLPIWCSSGITNGDHILTVRNKPHRAWNAQNMASSEKLGTSTVWAVSLKHAMSSGANLGIDNSPGGSYTVGNIRMEGTTVSKKIPSMRLPWSCHSELPRMVFIRSGWQAGRCRGHAMGHKPWVPSTRIGVMASECRLPHAVPLGAFQVEMCGRAMLSTTRNAGLCRGPATLEAPAIIGAAAGSGNEDEVMVPTGNLLETRMVEVPINLRCACKLRSRMFGLGPQKGPPCSNQ